MILPLSPPDFLLAVRWNTQGLVPAIAQERSSGDILMMAWMNAESLAATVAKGQAVYYSRSRGCLWHKGETSGHTQTVHSIRLDCDGDAILLEVTQNGFQPSIACHTGRHRCFFQVLKNGQWHTDEPVLEDPRKLYPAQS